GTLLVKVPFNSVDLQNWKEIVRGYRSDPVGVTKQFKFLVKQHNPNWEDMQLLLDLMTETEKQLVLKTANDLAKEELKDHGLDEKEYFPLQDPKWDPNTSAGKEYLSHYQNWITEGMEKAIPKSVNWAVLYTIKQGPNKTPSEFLD
ncbi:hypothetical protein N340_14391, partial [Tauraco erythrolophus]